MIKMKLKGGANILASPAKLESLKNKGWIVVKAKEVKEEVKEVKQADEEPQQKGDLL
tara:strand:+ start:363 stop:533 length:171 start_codon:yes stop_codon:yes gene_type:complete